MSCLYGVMSLMGNELRVYLSKHFNYSCFADLFGFVSSELSFKSVPLNILRCLHIGDTLSVRLSDCLSTLPELSALSQERTQEKLKHFDC
jgi:hypothetical protein